MQGVSIEMGRANQVGGWVGRLEPKRKWVRSVGWLGVCMKDCRWESIEGDKGGGEVR